MLKASDVMSQNPTTATPRDTIQTVAQLMSSENVGVIPVIEEGSNNRLVGVVTDRDIVVRAVAEGRNPGEVTVEQVMTPDVVTVEPGDDAQKAVELMENHQIRRILVCNGDQLVGVIAQADIARQGSDLQTGELVEEISQKNGAN